jgi:hypothetical protein
MQSRIEVNARDKAGHKRAIRIEGMNRRPNRYVREHAQCVSPQASGRSSASPPPAFF